MAIANIIARGVGFEPGSVGFIPTHGFTPAVQPDRFEANSGVSGVYQAAGGSSGLRDVGSGSSGLRDRGGSVSGVREASPSRTSGQIEHR